MNHTTTPDLVCFTHLPGDHVYQRPQQLMTRFARHFRVILVEDPLFDSEGAAWYETVSSINFIRVIQHLPSTGLTDEEIIDSQKDLLAKAFRDLEVRHDIFWYYTPQAWPATRTFEPLVTVYDCMNELSTSAFLPPGMKEHEQALMSNADVVFTAGLSLYEVKKHSHHNVHVFPSSIDSEHFHNARYYSLDPADQARIPHPRIGFFGVIDERMDLTLLYTTALRKPDWHFILVGPVERIEEKQLPKLKNIHYLGKKEYADLPSYLSGWDITMLPYAHNASTRFIHPTRILEYLTASKPVISTPINDVIRHYGHRDLVHIAGTADEFIRVAEAVLGNRDRTEWLHRVNDVLSNSSWDKTAQGMLNITSALLAGKVNASVTPVHDSVYA